MNDNHARADTNDEPVLLGQQFAAARDAEAKWRESGAGGNSPLPAAAYDFWSGDFSLIHPTANPLDDEIRQVCSHYALSDSETRDNIRHSISMDQFYTLINFARRSAVFGVREVKADLVVHGLNAIAMIEHDRVDFRDILWCLGLLYHAGNKAGGDADEMFRNAAVISQPEVARLFTNFVEQTPEYRNLRNSWGYDEVQTEHGIGFIGWGYKEFRPTFNLKSAIIEISEQVASNDYQSSSVEVAAELPDVWLGGRGSAASQSSFASIRAVARVSASLRPGKHPDYGVQHLIVFLVETASEADAHVLCEQAKANTSPGHSKFALARSRLFCLVVARAFKVDVNAYETDESLARFSDGLTAILDRFTGNE